MINSMTYKGYTANMVFDVEDKIIVGRVQDIDDIISFHGESVSEFESVFHAVIEDYLAAAKELGSAAERPASGKVMLRIVPEVHAACTVLVTGEREFSDFSPVGGRMATSTDDVRAMADAVAVYRS